MNAINSPVLDFIHGAAQEGLSEASGGRAQETPGSVMAFMIEIQHQLNKEATEDRKMMRQELGRNSHGFFSSIADFLFGADSGAGNVRLRVAVTEQSSAPWEPWKFLKVR